MPQEVFPPQILRPRPRPLLFCASTAALALTSSWTTESWPFSAAKCSGVLPREPRPQAEPNGTKGEKNSEKILAPQKSKWPKSRFKRLPCQPVIETPSKNLKRNHCLNYSVSHIYCMFYTEMTYNCTGNHSVLFLENQTYRNFEPIGPLTLNARKTCKCTKRTERTHFQACAR